MIGGFIVNGTTPKKVLARGIGPSLAPFGVANPLLDPVLQVFSGQTLLATNDNWQDTDPVAISATGLAPGDPRESALIMTLPPGAYTVIESGAQSTEGIALVEVYDLETGSASLLANISTRGVVEAGDRVMIGGVIVAGVDPGRFVVRALGPSLGTFGIPDPLGNPSLDLHDGNGNTIASNDNWRDDPQADDLQGLGLAPGDDLEPAVVRTLAPGNYTAIVRSVDPNNVGVALVEIYRE